MSKEVGILETTGEPTNASAARGTTPTLVVRCPENESLPEIPVMVLRSHSRGGRSSACAQEPSSQAGSYSTGNANLGVHSTRQEKPGPEPEIHPDHTNHPTDPTSVGTGLNPPPPEANLASTTLSEPVSTGTQDIQVPTGPQVYTGPQPKVYKRIGLSYRLRQPLRLVGVLVLSWCQERLL